MCFTDKRHSSWVVSFQSNLSQKSKHCMTGHIFTQINADSSRYSNCCVETVFHRQSLDHAILRGLVLLERSTFLVELNELLSLFSSKIVDMSHLERPTSPMAEMVHHSSSERFGVRGLQLPLSGSASCINGLENGP